MKTSDIQVQSNDRYEFVSITEEVKRAVQESGVEEGFCVIFSPHTTAGVVVNEDRDPDVPRDSVVDVAMDFCWLGLERVVGGERTRGARARR